MLSRNIVMEKHMIKYGLLVEKFDIVIETKVAFPKSWWWSWSPMDKVLEEKTFIDFHWKSMKQYKQQPFNGRSLASCMRD